MASVSRDLTAGELAYAQAIFGADLDYAKVKIHNYRAYPLQASDTAVTPNGEAYFPAQSYKPDFAIDVDQMSWLIHEMTHCWQHQKGQWVRLRAIFDRTYDYGDLAVSTRVLVSFSIEQQASIVADYFRLKHGLNSEHGAGALSDYERVIPFPPPLTT